MVADTYDSIIGMLEMGTGNQNNSWGTSFNASVTNIIGRAIAGSTSRGVTGGTLDLSGSPPPAGPRGDLDFIQVIIGVLASPQTIVVPAISRMNYWYNGTTGGFPLLLKVTGSSTLIEIPVNTGKLVINTGASLLREDANQVGRIFTYGGSSPPAGAFACNGASLLRTDRPDLFLAIGTTWGAVDGTHFTLPSFQDTGRFLRSSSGSLTVGTYQSNQNKSHTHTGSGTTSGASVNHTHSASGSTGAMSANASHTHTHNAERAIGGSGFAGGSGNTPTGATINATNTDHTHAYSFTSSIESVDHTHSYSFTTSTGSADGTEARPESAVVLMCIHY